MEATKRKYQKHKTDRKITLTYMLNTKLKPIFSQEDQEKQINPLYPIYIRIGYRRTNTSVKSRITRYCNSEKELDSVLNESSVFVNQEKEMIKSLILETDVVDDETYNFKKFGEYYQSYSEPAYEFLSNWFLKELLEIIRKNNGGRLLVQTDELILKALKDKPDAIVYVHLLFEDLGAETGKEYLKERSFLITKYIGDYTYGCNQFQSWNGFNFCVFDIRNNFFQSEIKRFFPHSYDDISMKILEEIRCKISGK